MENGSELLMLHVRAGHCPDCGDERLFLPVEGDGFCCTSCDAAVFWFEVAPGPVRRDRHVA